MKNIIMVLRWVVVALLLTGNLCANEFIYELYAYTVTNGAVKITAYADTINSFVDLQLPGTIDGMPVRHIGKGAFASIFLNSISIPDSIASIGDHAFVDNPSLSSFIIGTNIVSIGESILFNCTNLSYITVAENHPAFTSQDGVLFDKNMSILMQYPSGKSGVYTVPESVVSIANDAFAMSILSGIAIPGTVLAIGNGAFSACKQLESVALGGGVAQIGDYAFYGCSMLDAVEFPTSLTTLGEGSFYGCSNLSSVALPASLETLGQGAFALCKGLTNISVHTSNSFFTSIDGILFNAGVTELIQYPPSKEGNAYTVPSSVTHLGYAALSMATNLSSIVMSSNLVSIGTGGFAGCTGLESIVIPDSVTTLGDSVFFECTNLTSVIIGESVSSIGDYAFGTCSSLTGVYFRGDAPTLGTNVFLNATPTVYYLEGASGFGETFGGRPTEIWTP